MRLVLVGALFFPSCTIQVKMKEDEAMRMCVTTSTGSATITLCGKPEEFESMPVPQQGEPPAGENG